MNETNQIAEKLKEKLAKCEDNYDLNEFLYNYRNLLKEYDIEVPNNILDSPG